MSAGRIVILGGGESGVGSAILAMHKGFDVFLSDKSKLKDKYRDELLEHKIAFEEEQHTEEKILNATEIIKSPGIPDKAPLIKQAKEKGIPIISEIEFAARYTQAKLIGVTGTNGKTTTTSLIYHILKKAQLNVGLGGNIGKSFARQVALEHYDYYVLELSSFQLDGMYKTRINIAVLCNITPDHLDRYDYNIENYIDSKFRITQNQKEDDCFIYCLDDTITTEAMKNRSFQAKLLPFSLKQEVTEGAFLKDQLINININQTQFNMYIDELALQGKHNAYNSMAAGITARVLELRNELVRESMQDFEGIEHRLEFVAKVNGITFINDSKATNINSTWFALESMDRPTVWIVGGQDKGNDYESIKDLVKEKVKAIVCLGLENQKIIDAYHDIIPNIIETNTAQDAVKAAYRLAKKDEAVLLSPACASFDIFENYEDRGRQFKYAVRSL
jgi:UDP-N-acetylmuramoylalanine--D-glutamate ligase